jgi:multidrug efflux pump subunit AcrA (membrane-fusion protein)
MPVTAKLSKKFYDTFGDEIANELVEWFNAVDATYRAELRDLNEVNFARFDAKLEQRVAELDAKIDLRVGGLDAKIDRRVSELDAKIDRRVGELDAKIDLRVGELNAKLEQRVAELRAEVLTALQATEVRLIRWMFVFWVGSLGTTIALMKL